MNENDTHTLYRFFTEVGILQQLGRAMIEERLPDTMTANQFGLLSHLSRRPEGDTPLKLANAFQVPKTTMTHMIVMLERRGMVAQKPNPKDKRSKIVVATPEGVAFLQEAIVKMEPAMGGVVTEAGMDVFRNTLPALEEIREIMDRLRNPE